MNVRVALVGLGRVGSVFFQQLVKRQRQGVEIVAVAHRGGDNPALRRAEELGIPIFRDGLALVSGMGSHVDVLFDLTGDPEFRQRLRQALSEAGNRHTIVAPEIIAFLIWALIRDGDDRLPDVHEHKGY